MLVHALADLLYMEVIKMIVWCMCVHAFRGDYHAAFGFHAENVSFWAFVVAVAPTGSCACWRAAWNRFDCDERTESLPWRA